MFGDISVKNAKHDANTFWTADIKEKLKIGKMLKSTEMAVAFRQKDLFDIQNAKTQLFFKTSTCNFVHIFTGKYYFTHVVFMENSKELQKGKTLIMDIIYPIFKILNEIQHRK